MAQRWEARWYIGNFRVPKYKLFLNGPLCRLGVLSEKAIFFKAPRWIKRDEKNGDGGPDICHKSAPLLAVQVILGKLRGVCDVFGINHD
jgi:hypothetical protein